MLVVQFIKHMTIWQNSQETVMRFNIEHTAHDKMKTLSKGSDYF